MCNPELSVDNIVPLSLVMGCSSEPVGLPYQIPILIPVTPNGRSSRIVRLACFPQKAIRSDIARNNAASLNPPSHCAASCANYHSSQLERATTLPSSAVQCEALQAGAIRRRQCS
jgi:hypothetical protein